MTERPLRLAVIIGSTREGRFGDVVRRWFLDEIGLHVKADIDEIDLAFTPLPAVQQALPVHTGRYMSPDVQAFAGRIGQADGFIVVTPEYNHSYPAALKLAIDSVGHEWAAKPVAFVSYGGVAGGLRAVEHLRQVFAELKMVTVRNTVSFHTAFRQFDADGAPSDRDNVHAAVAVMLDELVWWTRALREARERGPFPG